MSRAGRSSAGRPARDKARSFSLVRAIFRLLEEFHQECNLGEARFATLSKQVVQQELAELFLGWLKTAHVRRMRQDVRPERIASAVQ